jgi:hypothetical protein
MMMRRIVSMITSRVSVGLARACLALKWALAVGAAD